jgi:hypothetical protein
MGGLSDSDVLCALLLRSQSRWSAMMDDTATDRQEMSDIAKCLLDKQWKELDYRRERENKLAAWSMVLLGGAAALVTAKSGSQVTEIVKQAFSAAAAGLSTLFGLFLIENRKRYENTQQVLTRQEEVLGAWDSSYWKGSRTGGAAWLGDALLPPSWLGWGDFGAQIMPRLDTITHIVAVWITAAAGIVIVHGDEWPIGVPYALIPLVSFWIWLRLLRLWDEAVGRSKGWWSEPSLRRTLILASIFIYGGLWFLPIYVLVGTAVASWYEGIRAVGRGIHIWILFLWGFIEVTLLIPLFHYMRDFRRYQSSQETTDGSPRSVSAVCPKCEYAPVDSGRAPLATVDDGTAS